MSSCRGEKADAGVSGGAWVMSDKEKLQTVSVEIENTKQYKYFIQTVKQKIETSQLKAHIKVNVELLKLYWEIAQMILEKQKVSQWG